MNTMKRSLALMLCLLMLLSAVFATGVVAEVPESDEAFAMSNLICKSGKNEVTPVEGVYTITANKGATTNLDFNFSKIDASQKDDAYIGFHIKYSEVPSILIRAYASGEIEGSNDTHSSVKFGGYVMNSADTSIKANEWFWVEIPLKNFNSFAKGNCYCSSTEVPNESGKSYHQVGPFSCTALCAFQFQIDDKKAPCVQNNMTVSFKDVGIYYEKPTDSDPALTLESFRCTTTKPAVNQANDEYTLTASKGKTTNVDFKFNSADASGLKDAYIGFYIKYSEVPAILIRAYASAAIQGQSDTHTSVKFGGYVMDSADTSIKANEWFWVEIPLEKFNSFEKGNCYCSSTEVPNVSGKSYHQVGPFACNALLAFQFQIDDSKNSTVENDMTVSFKNVGIYYKSIASDTTPTPDTT
ncbi:MAG: hypothetical protein IKM11_05770, partial [Oscillospiraceae bacterium]|nr:hypothetical protein [Oscillospiraceae bacterium]